MPLTRPSPDRPRTARRALLALVPVLAVAAAVIPVVPAAARSDAPRPIVSGWLPYWTTAASIKAMTANKDLLEEVSPFWYTVRWDGAQGYASSNISDVNKTALKAAAASAGISLWPSFTDSMPVRRLAWVMAHPKKRATLISRMVAVAVTEGYGGLDLDFEKFAFSDGSSTWATTRPAWVTFVRELAAALHAKGKKLSATTPPMCSMSGSCGPTML